MPSPTIILAILLALSVAGNGLLAKLYVGVKSDLAVEKDRYEAMVEGVRIAGKKAEREKAQKEKDDAQRKETADAENSKTKRDLAGLYDAYRSLRDQRARGSGGSVLPEAGAAAGDASRVTFDRATLDRGLAEADGVLQGGAEKILLRGDAAIVDLNSSRKWAKDRK